MNLAKRVTSYETLSQPVARWPRFMHRQLRALGLGCAMIAISLAVGMLGYHGIVGLDWVDAYENAAMILAGMGPMATPATTAGKIFAGTYALYSGIAVLAFAGVIAAPLVHRFLHRLHADQGRAK